jgi:predicted RNA-binding protein YlqC (UPF0109 family)
MEEIVKYIVNALVENKEAVSITSSETEKETVITVKVAKEDMGKVIGRHGKIAESIRSIVKTASSGTGKRYFVKFDEAE